MTKSYETEKSESIYQLPIFEIIKDLVRIPTGRLATRYTILHPGAAVFIPQAEDGTLYIVKQYRHSVGRSILEFPAGTLEPGEEPLACAKREIIEEVGRRAEEWISLGTLFPAPGFCNEVQHGFLARGLTEDFAPGDEDEIIDVLQMSNAEFEQAVVQGEVLDAKSISFFFRAKLMGLL